MDHFRPGCFWARSCLPTQNFSLTYWKEILNQFVFSFYITLVGNIDFSFLLSLPSTWFSNVSSLIWGYIFLHLRAVCFFFSYLFDSSVPFYFQYSFHSNVISIHHCLCIFNFPLNCLQSRAKALKFNLHRNTRYLNCIQPFTNTHKALDFFSFSPLKRISEIAW